MKKNFALAFELIIPGVILEICKISLFFVITKIIFDINLLLHLCASLVKNITVQGVQSTCAISAYHL
jgi:hypothetical protein